MSLIFKWICCKLKLIQCDDNTQEIGEVATQKQSLRCFVVCGLNNLPSIRVKSGLWLEYNAVKHVLLVSPLLSLENILSSWSGGVSEGEKC